MNPIESGEGSKSGDSREMKGAVKLEKWEAPQLVALDLGTAQAKFTMFGGEGAPDNGPLIS